MVALPKDIGSRSAPEAKALLKDALAMKGGNAAVFTATPISDASETEMVAELRRRCVAAGLAKEYELPAGQTGSIAGLVEALRRAGVSL